MADPYTTPDDVRVAYPVLENVTKFPDDLLEGLIAEFEQTVENARGVSYRRREHTESRRASRAGAFQVSWPIDVDVSVVSVDGTALTSDQLSNLDPVDGDCVLANGTWPRGAQVLVTYESGYDELPAGCVRNCGEFVRAMAMATAGNQPRNSVPNNDSPSAYTPGPQPNWAEGRFTGLGRVDAWINSLADHRTPGIG